MLKFKFKFVWTVCLMLASLAVTAQEICDNGIDDDGDSLVDLNDDECDCTNVVPLTSIVGNACRRLDLTLDVSGATSFQWYKDGVALVGYTNNTVAVTRWNPFGDGCYQLFVEHPNGCMLTEEECIEVQQYNEDLGERFICKGDSVVIDELIFEGEVIPIVPPRVFTTAGAQSFKTSRPSDGCDIRIAVRIVIQQASTHRIDAEICTGGTYINAGIIATEPGIYYDTLQNLGGCDSILRVDLKMVDLEDVHLDVEICQGATYIFHDISETESGVYMTEDLSGECDTFFVVNLTVIPPRMEERDISICEGGLFELGDISTDIAGTYVTTLPGSAICDSLEVTVNLTIDPIHEYPRQESICQGKTFKFRDIESDVSGTFNSLSTLGDCDSLIVIELSVLPPEEMRTEESICRGTSVEWRGNNYDTENIYTELEQVDGECDVLHVLDLKIEQPIPIEEDISICQGEIFERGDVKENESGIYLVTIEEPGQCDIVYEITLTVIDNTVGELESVLCNGDTFTLFDLVATSPGSYQAHTTNVMGCDSTINVELLANSLEETLDERSVCPGESTIFQGDEYSIPGEYTVPLTNIHNCDSLVTLVLTQITLREVDRSETICYGDTIKYNGLELYEEGTYETQVLSAIGCDTLVTFNIEVINPTEAHIERTICDGETFILNDIEATTEGSYMTMLQNVGGCDSTVTVELSVIYDVPNAFTAEICEGDVYINGDIEVSEEGRYETSFNSSLDCDSTIVVDLQVLPLHQRAEEMEICPGDVISFFGQELTEPGSYTTRFQNEFGCDSVVSFTIAYDPTLGDVELEEVKKVNLGATIEIAPLYVDENFVSFMWLDAEGEIMSIEQELTNFMPLEDTYVDFIATNANGCEVQERIRIDVELVVDIYIPNVITPDSDSYDSYFNIRANESVVGIEEIQIYDRWGELMYTGSHEGRLDDYFGWDGTFNGKIVKPAVFAYAAVFEIIDGSFVKKAGDLTVLR